MSSLRAREWLLQQKSIDDERHNPHSNFQNRSSKIKDDASRIQNEHMKRKSLKDILGKSLINQKNEINVSLKEVPPSLLNSQKLNPNSDNIQFKKENLNFHSAQTISVTGAKGGVGKTSLSLLMAKTLSDVGYRVLLIDCDFNLSNTLVKLNQKINGNFYHLIRGEMTFEEALYTDNRFHLLSGCNGQKDLLHLSPLEKIILNILQKQEFNYDFIFLDCPAGISHESLILNAYSDYRFCVVNPDRSSLTDTYALIKILNREYGVTENHLLLNKIENVDQAKKIVHSLTTTVDRFLSCHTEFLGLVMHESVPMDQFDDLLMGAEKYSIHQRVVQILLKFTEDMSKRRGLFLNEYLKDHQYHLSQFSHQWERENQKIIENSQKMQHHNLIFHGAS
jgi:flagellar biosynthesis protein FlhG